MGKYINSIDGKYIGTFYDEKCEEIENAGGLKIPQPKEWREGLVCVIDNGWMAAAGYAYSEAEMKVMCEKKRDPRPRQWFIFNRAKELAEWKKNIGYNFFHTHPAMEARLGVDKDHVIVDRKDYIEILEKLRGGKEIKY